MLSLLINSFINIWTPPLGSCLPLTWIEWAVIHPEESNGFRQTSALHGKTQCPYSFEWDHCVGSVGVWLKKMNLAQPLLQHSALYWPIRHCIDQANTFQVHIPGRLLCFVSALFLLLKKDKIITTMIAHSLLIVLKTTMQCFGIW